MPVLDEHRDEIVADLWQSLAVGTGTSEALLLPDIAWGEITHPGHLVSSQHLSKSVDLMRGLKIRTTLPDLDNTVILHVASALQSFLLRHDIPKVPSLTDVLPELTSTIIETINLLFVVDANNGALSLSAGVNSTHRLWDEPQSVSNSTAQSSGLLPKHARLSLELRQVTGLPAATLGAALGVTREQFQRWLKGRPISSIREGQLTYIHTIANEVVRRLGSRVAITWWRTPIDGEVSPEGMLKKRLIGKVHRIVSALPDPEPIVDGVMVALPAQQPLGSNDDYDIESDEQGDQGNPWSPYGEVGRQ